MAIFIPTSNVDSQKRYIASVEASATLALSDPKDSYHGEYIRKAAQNHYKLLQ